MPVQSERGYLITAVNTPKVNYIDCAYNLIKTIRKFHPDAKICLLTDKPDATWQPGLIDYYKTFEPPLNSNPYANDWQVFGASPFRQTIKLEADMVIASEIDHWWTMLERRDVVISTGARNFYDQPAESRYYRKVFDTNPGLVIDKLGITDNSSAVGGQTIKWEDITALRIEEVKRTKKAKAFYDELIVLEDIQTKAVLRLMKAKLLIEGKKRHADLYVSASRKETQRDWQVDSLEIKYRGSPMKPIKFYGIKT